MPAETPPAIVDRLNREIHRVLALPRVAEKLAADGSYPAPNFPVEFRRALSEESARWGALIGAANIKIE
ncbi:Tripartite tricarboxylate transporter family receptor [compost metagenome]